MVFNDMDKLRSLLDDKARLVGRVVDDGDVRTYFEYLQAFPIELIEKAATQALRDRDPNDEFQKTQMVTALEIEQAANRIIEERTRYEGGKCPKCGNTRWIVEEVDTVIKDAQGKGKKIKKLICHPCECLYNMAADIMRKKSRSNKDRDNDRFREAIIKSYEAYQRR